ncbi:hypothetical protein EPUS_06721 [Endocarpon pusillum Z07020]|uniref:Heterokaryon incompatibility domain-containing protein n=1 Tax=Endocarpon pusillum (strain Z07020 / HMAS-L-300199) TaxID=1263415 RepID=U1GGN2_ENDPU|nr:uncharacterized protein EPUS_06721 [Endocarpon pusillum Z07020]ERF70936.1 hypothetical protein EPUS_06721 [Endocarpon pusillum Z07020]
MALRAWMLDCRVARVVLPDELENSRRVRAIACCVIGGGVGQEQGQEEEEDDDEEGATDGGCLSCSPAAILTNPLMALKMNFLLGFNDYESTNDEQFEVVTAGKCCQEFDAFEKEAFEAFISRQRPRSEQHSTSTADASEQTEPGGGIYYPLTSNQQMRVLEVFPGEFDDVLQCKLHVCSIEFAFPTRPSEQPANSLIGYTFTPRTYFAISHATSQPIWYTALSYVWGNSAFVKAMICNGKPFNTTHNLDLALRYTRRTDASVMLWADQICINQGDLVEKTQQVLLMDKIYQRAWSTLVWLGEEGDNSSDAMDTIGSISASLRCSMDEKAPDVEDFERLGLPAPESQQWRELAKFLARPWFQRVWIIQEIVLSNSIQFQCGWKTISWLEINTFAVNFVKHDLTQYLDDPADENSKVGCTRITKIDRLKDYHTTHPFQSGLLNALVEGRGAQATDPRDKVFAIMGMTAIKINPDYSKSVSEIYLEAARKMVDNSYNNVFSVLCCVDHQQPSTFCPSWVPNWSSIGQTTSLGIYGDRQGIYEASRGTRSGSKTKLINDRLCLDGIIFDTTSNISPLASACLRDLIDPTTRTAQFVLGGMQTTLKNCQPYPSDSGLFNAFWHTLVAGKDGSGILKAPSTFAEVFSILLKSANGSFPSMPDQPISERRSLSRSQKHTYRQMQIAFEAAVKGRRFGTTSKRYMGLFPAGTKVGDQICVFLGGHIPFVVRPSETSGAFQLIGECYVHGIMDGEVMKMTDLKREEIQLV